MSVARLILLPAALAALGGACAPPASPDSEAAPSASANVQPQATTPAPANAPAPPTEPVPAAVPATDFRRQFVEVVKKVQPGVVAVTAVSEVEIPQGLQGGGHPFSSNPFDWFRRGFPQGNAPMEPETERRQGIGSGLIVEGGYILTNNHVVAEADELTVVLQDDRSFSADIVGTDPQTDLAVIKVRDSQDLPGPMALGDSNKLEVGEWVLALGAPFGLKQTVSAGIVSAVGRGNVGIADYEDFVQTDAAINPGNSGGPLVDLEGRVVGINTAIASRSGGNQGIGFAIPINMARSVMRQLIDDGKVVRAQLGVYIANLTPDLAHAFEFEGKGILVQDVAQEGPAHGVLQPGDIITHWEGKPVSKVAPFRNGIASSAPGSSVELTIFRQGDTRKVNVILGELPSENAPRAEVGDKQQARWGLALSDVTPEIQQQLGLPGTSGAVVMQVMPGSPAERAGLEPGDVILEVGQKPVKTAQQAQDAMLGADDDKPLRLRVTRDGRGLFVVLTPRGQ